MFQSSIRQSNGDPQEANRLQKEVSALTAKLNKLEEDKSCLIKEKETMFKELTVKVNLSP
jgi:hypothetical protein